VSGVEVEEVQDQGEDDGDGFGGQEQPGPGGGREHGGRVTQVRFKSGHPGAGQQGLRARYDRRVIVRVNDPAGRVRVLGDLVGVAGRGQSGADVKELAYPLPGQPADGPRQEQPVLPDQGGHRRGALDHPLGFTPVDVGIFRPAKQVVVDSGDARPGRVLGRVRRDSAVLVFACCH
jgi:hypothetical protein